VTLTEHLYGEVGQNARRLRTSTHILRQVCGPGFQADALTSSFCCAKVTSVPRMNPRPMDVLVLPGRSSAREQVAVTGTGAAPMRLSEASGFYIPARADAPFSPNGRIHRRIA
jgi:hypothetical protein